MGERKARCLLLVTRHWASTRCYSLGEAVVARYADGREWFTGEVAGVRSPEGSAAADGSAYAYDVQYDDGDFEPAVPAERVLSLRAEEGRWEYVVIGPEEATRTLPDDQSHPWWPNTEQFVDYVRVEATKAQLRKEVASLREHVAERYAEHAHERPWPLDDMERKEREQAQKAAAATAPKVIGPKARLAQIEGEAEATAAAAHDARVAADLHAPERRDELIYMFRKLAPLFLAVMDADLRYSHLQPHQPDSARIWPQELHELERCWVCAPVAQIAVGTRQKCDVCETSILDRHWACTVAGCEWEVCLQCHRQGEKRRAARRERYERLQRGDVPEPRPVVHAPWYTTQSGRSLYGQQAAERPRPAYLEKPREPPVPWIARRNAYEGDEASLQVKIDLVFPAVTNKGGYVWREFVADLPKDGKYAGQPCARCAVPNCTMKGKLFHHKNLATHGKPRGNGSRSNVYSRAHEIALHIWMSTFEATTETVEQVEARLPRPDDPNAPPPPPPPKSSKKGSATSSGRWQKAIAAFVGTGGESAANDSACSACDGRYRDTCGRSPSAPSGTKSAKIKRPKKVKLALGQKMAGQAVALAEEARRLVGDDILENEGRRKRQKVGRAETFESFPSERQTSRTANALKKRYYDKALAAGEVRAKALESGGDEDEISCFCDTDRHLPTNDIPFDGVWVCCDLCHRWCHGECIGLNKKQADALKEYTCPVCEAFPP